MLSFFFSLSLHAVNLTELPAEEGNPLSCILLTTLFMHFTPWSLLSCIHMLIFFRKITVGVGGGTI